MPGEASLQAQRYYAHAQNRFWWILSQHLGFPLELPYEQRLEQLRRNRIALWDVLAGCRREGSLDSAIQVDSEVANDFQSLFRRYPIRRILFNGGKAEQAWARHCRGSLGGLDVEVETRRLPSTSAAYAAMRPEEKLRRWREALP